ncbi:hypothetical protein S7711_05044 [Stachybotrys chartarum IBT 7711]|uniref:rhamnogalacturonan endolyase n=1 Tax=Stachybotrys chartarum (strain CBS 109288 / IBT 7711) TaxID=1280523 RepID=A0A084BAN4_STACB|nr:hypothetical protein S7711_05044 [Stachybotrys chartarum IBT 7711]
MKLSNLVPLVAGFGRFLTAAAVPFFEEIGSRTWLIGNDVWNMTQGRQYGTRVFYKGRDIVGRARGHYVSYRKSSLSSAWRLGSRKARRVGAFIDVRFSANSGDMHWVVFEGLHGAYQYFVNRALPPQGEFRSLWRVDNTTFPTGKTNSVDKELPPLRLYLPQNYVSDELWVHPDGDGYITKYDFGDFLREQRYYGLYGESFGTWYIAPGKDYYNGNHLKQELMVHRESNTGDAVMLNMLHGTHYQVQSPDDMPVGKIWGPWLWYLNDGSHTDVEARAAEEFAAWPYAWLDNAAYQARGSVSGRIVLSDGRPASNASVFLGDSSPQKSALGQGSNYYYATYADDSGNFVFEDVRAASYSLQAWPNGGSIGDVSTTHLQDDIQVRAGEVTDLGNLDWATTGKTSIFQLGTFDRLASEFKFGGAPREHGLVFQCPESLYFTIGTSATSDWCYGQTWLGTYTIAFTLTALPSSIPEAATLIVHLAGYSGAASSVIRLNAQQVGNLTADARTGPFESESLVNEQSVYRSATAAGEWRHFEFSVPGALMVEGVNELEFEVVRNSSGRGFMWDSIKLEW